MGGTIGTLTCPAWGIGFPGAGQGSKDPASAAGRQGAEGGAETSASILTLLPCPLTFPRELDGWVFVELDVGSEGNADEAQIQEVLYTVISSGSIASYVTSPQGFQFRRLGTGEPIVEPGVTSSSFSYSCGPPLSVPTMGFVCLGLHTTRDRELTTLGV